jgi:hypothetical protein
MIATPLRIRNQGSAASLPAPIVWAIASSQKTAVSLWMRRQRATPMRLRK